MSLIERGGVAKRWDAATAPEETSASLLIAFRLFQRQFVQSFMRAGIK